MKKLNKNLAMYILCFSMFVAVFCAMTLKAEAANVTTGTLGTNGGISWTYDADTKTLTITGSDSGLEGVLDDETNNYISPFESICSDVKVILVQDCTLSGSVRGLFSCLDNLRSVEFDNFDSSNVTDMSYMFCKCGQLTELDLSDFDTEKVTDMTSMFEQCFKLEALDFSAFRTDSLTSMRKMFYKCRSLSELDLSGFDTSDVTDLYYTFAECTSLTLLDLFGLDFGKVTNVKNTFSNCSKLWSIYTPRYMPEALSIDLPATYVEESNKNNFTTKLTNEFCLTCLVGVEVTEIKLSESSVTLNVGESHQLSATVLPENATRKTVTWKSFITSVATVDENGKITALAPGTITITAIANGRYAECKVYVKQPVTGIALDKTTLSLKTGATETLTAIISPDNASNKEVTWKSSDTAVATVSTSGKVTAVAIGTATITATTKDGSEKSASCEVTVVQPVKEIVLNKTSTSIKVGGSETLTVTVSPGNATNKEVTWKSSNTAVATVDSSGKVTALTTGTAIITATAKDGYGACASCEVTGVHSASGYLGDHDGIYWIYDADTKTLTITGEDSGKWDVYEYSIYGYESVFVDLCGDIEIIKLENCTLKGNINYIFANMKALKSIEFNNVDTSSVTDMEGMFRNCSSLSSLDLSGLNTGKVTDMSFMFEGCHSLTSLNISNFNTSQVTDMSYIFSECFSLTGLDVSGFDTSNVTDMAGMFVCCWGLESLDVSGFNTSQVTDMRSMFLECGVKSLDVTGFDTSNVTDMSGMFECCFDLESLDVSNFDTSKVEYMEYMFDACYELTSLDVSNFDTSKVTCMDRMFSYCSALTSLDLSNFDTSKVTSIDDMFMGCESLESLDVSSFDLSQVNEAALVFYWCDALKVIYTFKDMNAGSAIELPGTFVDLNQKQTTSLTKEFCNTTLVNINNLATKVELNVSNMELAVGESGQLNVTVLPETAAIKTANWKSSNTAVATVDANGKVTAVAEGTATITATAKDGTGKKATCEVTVVDPVRDFVVRMYTIVLGRAAEEQGLNDWAARLMAKEIDGATLVDMFVNSDEFIARNTSDEEYIKILYRAVLGREADAEGLKMWKNMLADGWTRDYIMEGLVLSTEFENICNSYGITAAFEPTEESQVRSFVKRMYTVVLNRRADAAGLNDWTKRLMNGTANGAQLADGFISSDEFVNRNLSNEKYIKVLYRAFFNREPDEGGFNVWMNELAKGVSRRDVMKGFVHSVEFSDLCAAYGIIRGEIQ